MAKDLYQVLDRIEESASATVVLYMASESWGAAVNELKKRRPQDAIMM